MLEKDASAMGTRYAENDNFETEKDSNPLKVGCYKSGFIDRPDLHNCERHWNDLQK